MNNDPSEAGIFTGKLFEYIGARRPVLLIGLTTGVAARLLRERSLGVAAGDSNAVAEILRTWLRERSERGHLPAPPAVSAGDLTRAAQTRKLEALLLKVISEEGDRRPAVAPARRRDSSRPADMVRGLTAPAAGSTQPSK
jgi:hypothetical protein